MLKTVLKVVLGAEMGGHSSAFRAFRSDPVPKEIIERVLKAASRSPSYMNTQPGEVVVISGKKREELKRLIQKLWEE